ADLLSEFRKATFGAFQVTLSQRGLSPLRNGKGSYLPLASSSSLLKEGSECSRKFPDRHSQAKNKKPRPQTQNLLDRAFSTHPLLEADIGPRANTQIKVAREWRD